MSSSSSERRRGAARAAGRTKALLLAAGLGTRLRPLTNATPKCLVPIGGRPLLDHWVDRLGDAGVTEAVINTHSLADKVHDHVVEVNRAGRLRLVDAFESELLGSAGTIAAHASLVDDADEIFIIYADNFGDVDLRRMLEFHRGHEDPLTMQLFRAPDPRACGIAELDAACRVVAFVEKPKEPRSDLANAGIYVVDAGAYREIAAMGAFDLGFEVLPRFVGRMRGWVWDGYHLDIGSFEQLERARRDAPALAAGRRDPGAPRRCVFLDRDGTLIEHVHYLSNPREIRLLPGAAASLQRLHEAGYACVVVTNQSQIGRGWMTEDRLREIHDEMNRQLAAQGAWVDAIYYCPEAPAGDDRTVIEHGDRKPGPGMLCRAARDMGLDLAVSWMVGDMISDVLAGINAGCRGSILVRTGKGLSDDETRLAAEYHNAADLPAAVELILDRRPMINPSTRVGRAAPTDSSPEPIR